MADKLDTCTGCRELEGRVRQLERAVFGAARRQQGGTLDSNRALTFGDLISPRQLANVARHAERAGVDAEVEAQKLFGSEVGALNRNAADRLITHLFKLAQLKQTGAPHA